MKYALLIYSPSTAEEYAVMATAARNTRDRDGEWVSGGRPSRCCRCGCSVSARSPRPT
jgi:hypothetical protein